MTAKTKAIAATKRVTRLTTAFGHLESCHVTVMDELRTIPGSLDRQDAMFAAYDVVRQLLRDAERDARADTSPP